MYKKGLKYLSKTNWRIHDESPTRSVNVLGLDSADHFIAPFLDRRAPCETVEQQLSA